MTAWVGPLGFEWVSQVCLKEARLFDASSLVSALSFSLNLQNGILVG